MDYITHLLGNRVTRYLIQVKYKLKFYFENCKLKISTERDIIIYNVESLWTLLYHKWSEILYRNSRIAADS